MRTLGVLEGAVRAPDARPIGEPPADPPPEGTPVMNHTTRQVLRSTATVAAAASLSLIALPAASASQTFDMYDVDRNGFLDPYVADASGNGIADQNVVLANGALLWLYDSDEDRRPDAYGNDNNGDGHADLWGHDANEDWVVDSWAYDPAVFAAQPTFSPGLTLVIQSQPLGTSIYDVIDTVNANGGIVTDPCAFYNGIAFSGTTVGCSYQPA
jgi:hypothetical protein